MNAKRKEVPGRRMSVRFEGRVQGVGFRYTTVEVASAYDISGLVRNEMDGTVTVVAEGAESDLVSFLRALKETHLARYITAERCAWSEATGEFHGFAIGHAW